MSHIFIYSSLIASVICISLSFLTYVKNKTNSSNKSFALLLLSIGIWTLFPYVSGTITDDRIVLLVARLVYIAAIFTPANFLRAISVVLGIEKRHRNLIKFSYVCSLLLLPFSFSKWLIKGLNRFKPNFYVDPGILYLVFILFFALACIYTFVNLYLGIRHSTGLKRNQLMYVFAGFIIAFIGGVMHVFAPYINIEFIPHDFFIVAFAIVISYAIVVLRLMDINIAIRKVIVNLILSVAICAGIISVVAFPFSLTVKAMISLLLSILLSLYLPRFKDKTENKVNHILYKGKYDYLDRLEKFVEKKMGVIPKEEDLMKDTAMLLTRDMYAKRVILLIRDHITGDYLVKYAINIDITSDIKLTQTSTIVTWLKKEKKAFVMEEGERILPAIEREAIRKELASFQASVCIPAWLDSDLIGIITLGNKTTGEMYTHIDLELLEGLGIKLAMALDYKRIEAQLRKELELASIGQMSMEISHELRNLLQLPATFIDLSIERLNDKDFFTSFRAMAIERMQVTRAKLDDIMYIGRDKPPDFAPDVDLNTLLDNNLLANDFKIKKENIELIKDYSQIPKIKADNKLLTHLFNNLILNAIEAMINKGGKLRVRTSLYRDNISAEMKDRSNEWVRIEVKDDGTGIPDHVMKKLFTPYVTTKSLGHIEKSGTGLGLPVVKKMVDIHKGYINVHTKEGKGTTFVVDLPVDLKPSHMPAKE